MRYVVRGANRDTGEEMSLVFDVASATTAERQAQSLGLLVSEVAAEEPVQAIRPPPLEAPRIAGIEPAIRQRPTRRVISPALLIAAVLSTGLAVAVALAGEMKVGSRTAETAGFLLFLAVLFSIATGVAFVIESARRDVAVAGPFICSNANCGFRGLVRRDRRGSMALLIILIVVFWPVAIVYYILACRRMAICPNCGLKHA